MVSRDASQAYVCGLSSSSFPSGRAKGKSTTRSRSVVAAARASSIVGCSGISGKVTPGWGRKKRPVSGSYPGVLEEGAVGAEAGCLGDALEDPDPRPVASVLDQPGVQVRSGRWR